MSANGWTVLLKNIPGDAGKRLAADADAITLLLVRGYITPQVADTARGLLGDRIEGALKSIKTSEDFYHVDKAI